MTSNDLLEAFETTITLKGFTTSNFTKAFRTWETQKGYPIIHVRVDGIGGQFSITQQRYYAVSEERVDGDERSWYIPLNFATESDHDFENTTITHYFVDGESSTNIPFPVGFDVNQWFIFNKQQIGYYRVNYDNENWNAIANLLNSERYSDIHVLNRAQLIDDAMNLAADGYLDYSIAMDILNYLGRETDYIPWRAAVASLDKLDYQLKGRTPHESYRTFVRLLARRMYAKYGLEEKPDDTLMDKFAREVAIDWTCRMGDAKCLTDTYAYARKIAFEGYDAPDSLEIVYLCHGLKGFNKQTEYAAVFTKMQQSEDQAERVRLIDAMLCSTDPEVLKNLMETAITSSGETYYRAHERSRIVSNAYIRSPVGLEVTTQIISEFYNEFVSMLVQLI